MKILKNNVITVVQLPVGKVTVLINQNFCGFRLTERIKGHRHQFTIKSNWNDVNTQFVEMIKKQK